MKNFSKTLVIAGCTAFSFHSISVQAADWTIMQSATITSATPELKQGDVASVTNSTQSVNGIALEATVDNVTQGSQEATITGSTSFKLTQGGIVTGAKQAINHIRANAVGSSGNTVTQMVTGTSTTTTLEQKTDGAGAGDSNIQAMNVAEADGAINSLAQGMTESGSLGLIQSDVPTNENTQSMNHASGNVLGIDASDNLEQIISITGLTTMTQSGDGSENVQAVNLAVGTGSASHVDNMEQSYTATGGVQATQNTDTGGSNIQALNLADTLANSGGNVSALSQTITFGGVSKLDSQADSSGNIQIGNLIRSGEDINSGSTQSLTKNSESLTLEMTGSGTNNQQAGNMASAEGNIDGLSQTFIASSSTLTFLMTVGTSAMSNTQAGNMVVVNGTNSDITDLTQSLTASDTDNDFTQRSTADGLIQAGNLIDLGTGGMSDSTGPHQTFTAAGAVSMTQESGSTTTVGGMSNLQAINATVDTAGGTLPVNLVQTMSATGDTFVMAQNGVANSGQFGNFGGLRY